MTLCAPSRKTVEVAEPNTSATLSSRLCRKAVLVLDARDRIVSATPQADALIRTARGLDGPIVGAHVATLLPETLPTPFGRALAEVRRTRRAQQFVMPSVYFPGERLIGGMVPGPRGTVRFTFQITGQVQDDRAGRAVARMALVAAVCLEAVRGLGA